MCRLPGRREEVERRGRRVDDGIVVDLLERGEVIVGGPGETRPLPAVPAPGVERVDVAIDGDRTARPTAVPIGPGRIGRHRHRAVPPVDEVIAHGVAPVNGVMIRPSRVVLIKQVVGVVVVDEAVGVVEPVGRRREMVSRSIRVVCERVTIPEQLRSRLRTAGCERRLVVGVASEPPDDVRREPLPGRFRVRLVRLCELHAHADPEDRAGPDPPLKDGRFGRDVRIAAIRRRQYVRPLGKHALVADVRPIGPRRTDMVPKAVKSVKCGMIRVHGLPERADRLDYLFGPRRIRRHRIDAECRDLSERARGTPEAAAVGDVRTDRVTTGRDRVWIADGRVCVPPERVEPIERDRPGGDLAERNGLDVVDDPPGERQRRGLLVVGLAVDQEPEAERRRLHIGRVPHRWGKTPRERIRCVEPVRSVYHFLIIERMDDTHGRITVS